MTPDICYSAYNFAAQRVNLHACKKKKSLGGQGILGWNAEYDKTI